jgi:hypothetical protein
MLRQIFVVAITGLLLLGCAQPDRATADQAAAKRAKPFVEGQAALSRYAATSDCANADASAVKKNIAKLQEMVLSFHKLPSGFYHFENEAHQRHTALAFGYADEGLKKGCLDDADKVYRELISFYTGSAYDGIRDRAKLGIDDVRVARNATQ